MFVTRSFPHHIIRIIIPHNINLARQNRQPNDHRNSDDGQIDSRKLETPNVDMLSSQDIAPQHASQGSAERKTERSVVDADSHAVHGAPERAIGDWNFIDLVNFLPGLDDSGDENRGSDVCACEL